MGVVIPANVSTCTGPTLVRTLLGVYLVFNDNGGNRDIQLVFDISLV